MASELSSILKNETVRSIPTDRNYWFIRSYGGKLYEEFFERSYVGIGFNSVPFEYIRQASERSSSSADNLKEYLRVNYNLNNGSETRWANQLVAFESKVKIGDIIVVPSDNSDEFAIGEIIGNTKIVDDNRTFNFNDNYEPYPEKRKEVNWIKKVKRLNFIGDTRSMISSHQAISSINFMSEFIESNISSLFFRGDFGYFTLKINRDEDINAFDLNRLLSNLTYFYKELCKELGEDDNEELFIKIKVQSKGSTSFKGTCRGALIGLAILYVLPKSEGTKFEIGNVIKFESKGSEGLAEAVYNFVHRSAKDVKKFVEFLDAREKLKAESIENTKDIESDKELSADDIES